MSKKLFIASSREGREYASALKNLLTDHFSYFGLDILCLLWSDRGVFHNGESTLASLEKLANEIYAYGEQKKMGYAVFVLTPDEIVNMRGKEYYIARDNVLFEYGLFLGKLGHDRTFVLVPPTSLGDGLPDFHMLTDLNGITAHPYTSYNKKATSTQAKDDLMTVALHIFQDIYEIEKTNLSCLEKHEHKSNIPHKSPSYGGLTSY